MKITVTLLALLVLFLPHTPAQEYTQLNLPEGAIARLGKGTIHEIEYSPDGTRLVVASSIGIWLYDTAIYQEVALLTGYTGDVYSVAFSPDGSVLASGGWDSVLHEDGTLNTNRTVRLWDAVTGELKEVLAGHGGRSKVYRSVQMVVCLSVEVWTKRCGYGMP